MVIQICHSKIKKKWEIWRLQMNKKFLVLLLTAAQVETLIEARDGHGGGGSHHSGSHGGHGSHHGNHGRHRGGGSRGGRYGGRWGGRGAWAGFAWGALWFTALTAPLWYSSSGRTQQDWDNISKLDRIEEGINYLTQQLQQTPNDESLKAKIKALTIQFQDELQNEIND